MNWTKDRLQEVTCSRLNGRKLIVVANREPYIHVQKPTGIELVRPAGGLTTALDPIMRACGGVWIGHGSGSADRQTADERGRLLVPPENPSYTLRRIWLSAAEEEGYYYGFANNALWPLCHHAYCRPRFDPACWEMYRGVNQRFADAVLEEAENEPALVFVQDYHFALLPRFLKQARPDLIVAQFWHIPWPSPETFRICPWGDQILDGMLGNDLLSFHIQYHCNNFRDTVERSLECRIDSERFTIHRNGSATRLRPHSISIDPDLASEYLGQDWVARAASFRQEWSLGDRPFLISVDRMDYTKGIPERIRAVDRLFDKHPHLRGRFHLVQIGAPSRTHLSAYQQLDSEVMQLTQEVNARHGTDSWKPIIFLHEHVGPKMIYPLYRSAAGCVVSSLHDGMNLVAKEFVSSRDDEQGVLILSRFTGAARSLTDALLVNPYDVDQLANAMVTAMTMPSDEQRARMQRMRRQVRENNIYRWAGRLLSDAIREGETLEPLYSRTEDAGEAGGASSDSDRQQPTVVANEIRAESPFVIDWCRRVGEAWHSGRQIALFFDYDGTLTPIVPHPELAVLPEPTRDLLAELARLDRVLVGVISGRSLADLKGRIDLPGLYYAGCSGSEIDFKGHFHTDPVACQFLVMREQIQHLVKDLLGRYSGSWIEVKPLGLSVHYRAVDPNMTEFFRYECRAVLESVPGIVLHDVAMAFEVTPIGAWDKGNALEKIMQHAGGDWIPVYAGDSGNDASAMAMSGRFGGIRVGVGKDCPQDIDIRVASPSELAQHCSVLFRLLLARIEAPE